MSLRCVILGGGGHAKVVIEALRAAGILDPVAIVDADPARKGMTIYDVPVVGDDSELLSLKASGVTCAVAGVGGVKDNQLRRRVMQGAEKAGLVLAGVIHPSAIVSPSAKIAPSVQILAGAVVGPDTLIAEGALINTRSVVEHDCRIGEYVHVATGAVVAGTVFVNALAHIGAGATIRQDMQIGERAVVGAGAVVVRDVEAGQTVVGVPARPL
jgi:sugar O-acyltransferase (sialic acid O-acetyltransferase NeuD family)